MRTALSVCLIGLFTLVTASADQKQGTATSSSSFNLRGADVNPSYGVSSFPVKNGDDIKAGNSSMTIKFPDGSSKSVPAGSSGKIEYSNGRWDFKSDNDRYDDDNGKGKGNGGGNNNGGSCDDDSRSYNGATKGGHSVSPTKPCKDDKKDRDDRDDKHDR